MSEGSRGKIKEEVSKEANEGAEIPTELDNQEYRIEKLSEQINKLNQRLEPVSQELPPEDSPEQPESKTKIGGIINRNNHNLQVLEEKVVDMMQRLEI